MTQVGQSRHRPPHDPWAGVTQVGQEPAIDAAGAATDDEVAERVREWETAQGLEPRDWRAIGDEERDPDDDEVEIARFASRLRRR